MHPRIRRRRHSEVREERLQDRRAVRRWWCTPDTGHAAYVPNQGTMKPESEMTVAHGGNHTNENPGDSADTESEAIAVPAGAMAAECPSRHRCRSNTLSRCRNDSASHRAFRTITTEVRGQHRPIARPRGVPGTCIRFPPHRPQDTSTCASVVFARRPPNSLGQQGLTLLLPNGLAKRSGLPMRPILPASGRRRSRRSGARHRVRSPTDAPEPSPAPPNRGQ